MRRGVGWLVLTLVLLAAPAAAVPEGPEDGTPEWTQRELSNYLKTKESTVEELVSPGFQVRLAEQTVQNGLDYELFQLENAFLNYGNACRQWGETCVGDPFRYPGSDPFWDEVGGFTEALYHDRDCGRISGRVWYPLDGEPGDELPGIIITNGSVQAPETLYWWAAQALVEAGYLVMTWDPRGQGRSDSITPDGQLGSNFNDSVFWNGTVDAIDFFHSTPDDPYPHNATCAERVAANPLWTPWALPNAAAHNPHHELLDHDRLGLAGHSLGARGVSRVQAMDPWEGQLASENPVDVIVAWDSLSASDPVVPRVPAMGQSGEYGLTPVAFDASPDPEGHKDAFAAWAEAGQPVAQFTIRGSSHYEWSLIPSRPIPEFSSTSWREWGNPMAEHYTVAWFDRWLKEPDEPGYADADARLLDDQRFCERFSFYFRSARDFPDRDGVAHEDDDIRASCLEPPDGGEPVDAADPAAQPGGDAGGVPTPSTGGGALGFGLALLATATATGRRRLRS